MLHSMTGYGKAERNISGKRIAIEVKTLNSKQGDIFTRIPPNYKEKELTIRKMLTAQLQRGKIECNIYVENFSGQGNYSINQALAMNYYEELKSLASATGNPEYTDFLPLIVKMPDVLVNETNKLAQEEWEAVEDGLLECLSQVSEYRREEGEVLEKDFLNRIQKIEKLLESIPQHEEKRIKKLKEKLNHDITEMLNDSQFDKNRLEQEMIYYIEKFDITEEKVRLKNHCAYFRETLNQPESLGKKLNFIGQEIGREINTIGSKANDTDIQHIVVMMKDELEKIKEQVLNIL
ncbi:MAG: YicC/YloC family endoribonuclease [Bacteroidota bacterium]